MTLIRNEELACRQSQIYIFISFQQAVKSAVQTLTVGGVGTSQFKTIIPLATAPNVQQIQVPGSKFHYVRLVTATTASSTAQPANQNPSTSTATLQQG